jgi:hypothetical protein
MTPPKLGYDDNTGKITGANVSHNSPWPCENGDDNNMLVPHGIIGVVMHTMIGDLPGTVEWFNNPGAQASAHFGVDQNGNIWQFGPVNGWMAWAEMAGNPNWYSIEHADDGNPLNPLTQAQVDASAQLVEVLSRPDVGNFPMVITNSISDEGYGVHCMGGIGWGGHTCPQDADGSGPRSGQRTAILAVALAIRAGTPPPVPPKPPVRNLRMLILRTTAPAGYTWSGTADYLYTPGTPPVHIVSPADLAAFMAALPRVTVTWTQYLALGGV